MQLDFTRQIQPHGVSKLNWNGPSGKGRLFMNYQGTDTIRIRIEYERRAREIPDDSYSLGKPANLLMYTQTIRGCIAVLQRGSLFPLKGLRVADIGCGVGEWLLEFIQWGAEADCVAGIDLMPARLECARRRIPGADLHIGNASELPWKDESFDLLSQILVFTNMLDSELKRAVAKEMLRVLKPGGAILWFDLRVDNPRNPEVKGLRRKEIVSLFPGCDVDLTPTLLAPPLSRLVARRSWVLAEVLHTLPFLRTHYAGLIRKRGTSDYRTDDEHPNIAATSRRMRNEAPIATASVPEPERASSECTQGRLAMRWVLHWS